MAHSKYYGLALSAIALFALSACQTEQEGSETLVGTPYITEGSFADICKTQSDNENSKLPLHAASDDWFQVYESVPGVFSIVEPYQFQESISYLIVGESSALLFDTGVGLYPIRPIVERLTDLPVTVLNSHTHYDHVGGNAEFSSILAVDTGYTRANMAGFSHDVIAADLAPDAFCHGLPTDVDLSQMIIKPWTASGFVKDGEIIDLGGRQLEILHIPGHTPDSTALLDKENGLLFTGDSFYDAELWLFVQETDLDAFDKALSRLVVVESEVDHLFGAHRSARVDAGRLAKVQSAFRKLRESEKSGYSEPGEPIVYTVNGIEFVTSQAALDGMKADPSKGGSGLN